MFPLCHLGELLQQEVLHGKRGRDEIAVALDFLPLRLGTTLDYLHVHSDWIAPARQTSRGLGFSRESLQHSRVERRCRVSLTTFTYF